MRSRILAFVQALRADGVDVSVAETMRDIKGNSSKWIHETIPGAMAFAWQTGYGAFTVSFSQIEAVKAGLKRILNDEADSVLLYTARDQRWLVKEVLGRERSEVTNLL